MELTDFKSVLLLGVGGVSMHQIAYALIEQKKIVYGYDMKASDYTNTLQNKGMKFTTKFNKNFLNVDLCISTGAISKTNRYIKYLNNLNIKIIDRAEALAILTKEFKCVIAVAGTHGKSTTASLIYEILRTSGRRVSCHIGADVFAPRFELGDDYLVVEACEYKKSFLKFTPTISVVTNVEADHMDSYGSMFNLRSAFSVFLRKGKARYVMREKTTEFLKLKDVNFVTKIDSEKLSPKIKGEHNLKNISLALAVVKHLDVDEDFAIKVINRFEGIPRRYERIGEYDGKKVYIDYAHHPTEIEQFTKSFISEYNNALIVFQPHTYSRTKLLKDEFVRVLGGLKNLIIYKEYPARETRTQGMTARELAQELKTINPQVKYCASLTSVFKTIGEVPAVAFVGAGDINILAKRLTNIKK